MSPTKNFQDTLQGLLRDPQEAAEYINAVLEEGDAHALALALSDVAQAQGLPLPEDGERGPMPIAPLPRQGRLEGGHHSGMNIKRIAKE